MSHEASRFHSAPPGQTLDHLVSEISELTSPPAVAMRVVELARDQEFSAQELARVVSSDPALSVKVLRLANSAYYGYAREISTVRDAVVLLGFRAVRSAAFASSIVDMLPHRATTLDPARFWHFSITVAALAELLGQAEGRHPEEAFTAGVLHNVGRLAFDHHRPRDLITAIQFAEQEDISIAEAERAVVGFTDADLGAALAEQWNFPDHLVDAVARHQLSPAEIGDRNSLASVLVRARSFAFGHGSDDGIERVLPSSTDAGWLLPPLSRALESLGGITGMEERADGFLGSILGDNLPRAA